VKDWLRLTLQAAAAAVGVLLLLLLLPLAAVRLKLPPAAAEVGEPAALAPAADVRDLQEDLHRRGMQKEPSSEIASTASKQCCQFVRVGHMKESADIRPAQAIWSTA
jgi:hypothetical protein